MVLGNFALLAGIALQDINEWFLVVYADPYVAGGTYMDKMLDYCKECAFNPHEKTGKVACSFNYLYWDFLQRNRERLRHNPRVAMM